MKVASILAFVAAVAIAAPTADPLADATMDVAEFEAREAEVAELEFDAREVDDELEFEARDDDEEDEEDDDDEEGLEARLPKLPTLNRRQSNNARAIFTAIKKTKVGKHGCQAVFATGLVESSLYIYANKAVPKSLKYHHDKVGSDHDSVGIFQQRAMYYKNIKKDMDPAGSAEQFISKMTHIKGWKKITIGKLCQKVQVSAYPDRYNKKVHQATQICAAGGFK